ncbi:TonB-dependent receptor [Dyadobacter chenwenxiniae]|uniref:TonB-dependent receptor n=1 Tax=Dyadobacter chenwenxiniae TaxID=2906456 RepID=A0A9X1PQH0_9BACT|nr:TonB-dependent receptor [Dyadobacter chenwenxiniae]MCF0064625.1 TonB-dependent receptor [Dyadobacter chenwenxiniae]UON84319.1 TonB-dependent receptor [Dyadobacter chenwenxiniae]
MVTKLPSPWIGKSFWALLLVAIMSSLGATAQTFTIKGKVTSPTDQSGVPGINVILKNTTSGTTTNADGGYEIQASESGVLVFSGIGYRSSEISVNDRSSIDVTLEVDTKQLNEIVVVGYGTQKKSDVTGAVGSVKMDREITSRPIVELGQALYGKIPGVQVLSSNGRPGTSSTIQIRGINSVSASSSPLVVIDGMPIPNYDLNLLSAGDIESMEVLKDASSAAIYGSRGANGVILITTKSGKEGKTKFNVNYSYGVQKVIDRIAVMNSREYAQASIDAAQNGWIESGGDPAAPNTIEARKQYKYTWPAAFDNPENLQDTDWQDVVFRTSPMQKIELNASGGNAKTNFIVSAGYVKQKGIVITSEYKKYTFNIKASSQIKKWLQVGGMLNVAYDHENEPFNRTVEWAVQYPTIYPVYGNNGYLGAPANTPGFEKYDAILFRPKNGHPLYQITDDIQHRQFNNLGNVFAQIDFLPGLRFRSSLNFFYNRIDNNNYQAVDHNLGPTYYTEGIMTVNQSRTVNYTSQNLLTYDKTFKEHSFSALAGMEYNNNEYYYTNQERRGYDNDLIKALSAGKTVFQAEDDKNRSILISYFSRLNYTFKGRYLLSASIRRDGSSRFGPNNKWGVFPSVSGGWIVSDESFLSSVKPLNNLKLRASYGFTGNDRFADYKWIGAMSQGRVAFGSNLGTTYYPGSITNPDLEWERTQQFNAGVDLGLFGNRIVLEADYYISRSDGLLLDVPVPIVSGFNSVFKNIGKLQNKGLELNLTTHNLKGALGWTSQLNFSRNRNKVLALGKDNAPMIYQPGFGMESINQVGQPIFSFYGYRYDGVYMNQGQIDADPSHYASAKPGDGRYVDINGDGVLNAKDRTIIGNYAPDFIWGFTNNLTYKGFDLSVLIQGVQGSDVYDNNIHRSMLYHEGRNYYKEMTNRWRSEQEPGDGYHYKLTVDLDGYEKTASSYWIVDGSYFRVKSLTAGYTFPSGILSKLNLESLRIYVNGQNLFTHKNAPIFDPENFNGSATSATARGVTHSPYPSAKVYTFGVNIGF